MDESIIYLVDNTYLCASTKEKRSEDIDLLLLSVICTTVCEAYYFECMNHHLGSDVRL